jgi:16S rRNA processing protein RimM
MEVVTVGGERVGTVREVYELRPAHMLAVRTETGELLIPFTKELVMEIDRSGGILTIDPPEGLLDL